MTNGAEPPADSGGAFPEVPELKMAGEGAELPAGGEAMTIGAESSR
jgi:hypothetical protein